MFIKSVFLVGKFPYLVPNLSINYTAFLSNTWPHGNQVGVWVT